MTSIKVKLRTNRSEKKECALFHQIIHRRRVRQVATGLKLHPAEWDSARQTVVLQTDDEDRQAYLLTVGEQLAAGREAIRKVVERLQQRGEFCVEQIVSAYTDQTLSGYLFTFMEAQIRQLRAAGRYRTSETYRSALCSFRRFRKEQDIEMSQMTGQQVQEYEHELKKQGLRLNTVSFYMRILRAVYNRAVDQGLAVQSYPFRHVYTGIEKTRKRAVGEEVIVKLKRLDLSRSPHLSFARDLFLFSFYARGMSFVDMAYLKKSDLKSGMIHYQRRKTGQQLTVRLEPCLAEIVERYAARNHTSDYLLPIFDPARSKPLPVQYANALSYQNRRLKQLSLEMQLSDPLTSYVSRHTWATVARKRNIPLAVISQGMGHDSETTTQIYLASLDQHLIDRANRFIIRGL